MKLDKKSLHDKNSSSASSSGGKNGCGCGTKHGATAGYEIEETDIEVKE